MVSVATGTPDDETRAAVHRLAARIEAEDGAPPLSDQALTRLASPEPTHLTVRSGAEVVGYAQQDAGSAEIAAGREVVALLVDAVAAPGVRVWSHGRHSRLAGPLAARGFETVRELHQLRRGLEGLPADPPLPTGVAVRPFVPGRDDQAWLALNAAAFATHAEQGGWGQADLRARVVEPWFDAAGFLLAWRDGELLGYHWTKVHPDGLGEVYVLGIAPSAQGLGLGNALLVRGLRHLAGRGCPAALLYVDGDNAAARHLYRRSGFTEHDLDVQWRLPG